MHVHAGWNMPGYQPEMDPGAFANMAEAALFLANELDRWADGLEEDDRDYGAATEAERYFREFSEQVEPSGIGHIDWGAGRNVYWATVCEERPNKCIATCGNCTSEEVANDDHREGCSG
jgi:hypothetical protein